LVSNLNIPVDFRKNFKIYYIRLLDLSGVPLTNTTMEDIGGIHVQLEAMTSTIRDLRGDFKSVLKTKWN
jgi:hypothetical protein